MIDLMKIYNEIQKQNPNIELSSIEVSDGIITVVGILENEYYELCKLDVKTGEFYVNKFIQFYDNFTVNEMSIKHILTRKKDQK